MKEWTYKLKSCTFLMNILKEKKLYLLPIRLLSSSLKHAIIPNYEDSYFELPYPSIGRNIKGKSNNPIVNPKSFPNFLDSRAVLQTRKIKLINGIQKRINQYHGLLIILKKTMVLYMGMKILHPGWLDFL